MVGLTKKTIQRYETGEIRATYERLSELADALGIEVSKLLDGTGALTASNSQMELIPVYENISCGNGCLALETPTAYEATPKEWLNSGDYFYIRAKGDSMTGVRIHEGDLLLIRQQPVVEDGEIAAVIIDGKAMLKRVYYRDGKLILQSENPNYPPEIVTEGDVRIIGKLKKIVIDM
jgi:repressor LexA